MRKMSPQARLGECGHYWKIESARGETSRGICKICGEARDFSNSMYPNMQERIAGDRAAKKERKAMAEAGYAA